MRKKSLNPKATENRRESSRNAARTRRCVEGQIFHEMLSVLPFGHGGAAGCGSGNGQGASALHIDKISVIRISLAYIKLRQILRYHFRNHEFTGETPCEGDGRDVVVSKQERSRDTDAILSPPSTPKLDPYSSVAWTPVVWPNLVRDMLKALDCFFLVISAKGNLLYVSDNVEHYLGIPKTCLVGHRFLDFVHPCDQKEVNEALAAAAISHKVSLLRPNVTPLKTGSKFKGAAFRTEPKPEGAVGSGLTRQVSDHIYRCGLVNNLDDFEHSPPPLPQQAPSSSVAAVDMIVRLKSLSTLASACTFEPPQQPRVDATLSQFCQSPDPDTYAPQQSTEGDRCSPDTTGSTQQTHHQLRLNINFLQQQPNHKVMHLYGHTISKLAPRRAEAPGNQPLCQAVEPRLEPRSKSYARPVHAKAKNCVLTDSPLSMAPQPGAPLEDELSFYIFLVATPVCGTLFDKVTSRCLDKHSRNRLPISPTGHTIESVEKPLSPSGHNAIVSRHQMDMKILFFDEIVTDVLGYEIWQMIGRSFYDFIHVLDLDTFRKNLESLHQKGQIETGMYRLLVNNGGYVWVSTQASLVSYPTDSSTGFRPSDARCDKSLSHHHNPKFHCVKQVVCLHKIVSLREGQDHILADLQKPHHQSHLWKGISLRTEQILFKNLPGSAPSTKNLLPNANSNCPAKASVTDSNSTCRAKFATGGLAPESLSGAALYDGPVLALNLSQARALKRNHRESQVHAPDSINAFASFENSWKVGVEKDSLALDLYKRAPCLAHEYLNTHASTKVGVKDSFTAISVQPAVGSHKRRKNVTATPESVARHTLKNGPKQSIDRKNQDTAHYPVQVRPRVILPKKAATHRLPDFVVDSVAKGLVRNPDEDFFTRAPLAGDSCVSVDSSILLSPMGLKRKEITKLVQLGDGPLSKPLCITSSPDIHVSYEDKYSAPPPTITLNGLRDEDATSEYFDLCHPLDPTDSMENILDDIMSLQEDKGIMTFSNEAVGHVEEIKRALLDHGRNMKSQSVFGQSSNDNSSTTSIGMLNKNQPPMVPCKTTNPDITIMPATTPARNLNPQSTRHLLPPSHILNSRSTAAFNPQNRPLVPPLSVATSQSVYHSVLRYLNCTTNHAIHENTVNSSKKRTDPKSVPTGLANGVLANLLRNGEDPSYGYKCFSPCPNPTIATKHEPESLLPHFETKNFLSARRNSEPVMTTDHLLKSVMSMKPSTPEIHVKLEKPTPDYGDAVAYSKLAVSVMSMKPSTPEIHVKLEKPTPDYGDAVAYSKLAVFATAEDKVSNGHGYLKYTDGHVVGQTNDTTMYGAVAIECASVDCGPPSDHDYMSDFARDYADGRAILGDAYGLEEVEDHRPYNESVPFYLGSNHGSETCNQQLHGAAAATLLKALYAAPGATTGLLNDGYDCNDELYNLNTDGMNVFEETNILDDV